MVYAKEFDALNKNTDHIQCFILCLQVLLCWDMYNIISVCMQDWIWSDLWAMLENSCIGRFPFLNC